MSTQRTRRTAVAAERGCTAAATSSAEAEQQPSVVLCGLCVGFADVPPVRTVPMCRPEPVPGGRQPRCKPRSGGSARLTASGGATARASPHRDGRRGPQVRMSTQRRRRTAVAAERGCTAAATSSAEPEQQPSVVLRGLCVGFAVVPPVRTVPMCRPEPVPGGRHPRCKPRSGGLARLNASGGGATARASPHPDGRRGPQVRMSTQRTRRTAVDAERGCTAAATSSAEAEQQRSVVLRGLCVGFAVVPPVRTVPMCRPEPVPGGRQPRCKPRPAV
jgi:hypothetical protein